MDTAGAGGALMERGGRGGREGGSEGGGRERRERDR